MITIETQGKLTCDAAGCKKTTAARVTLTKGPSESTQLHLSGVLPLYTQGWVHEPDSDEWWCKDCHDRIVANRQTRAMKEAKRVARRVTGDKMQESLGSKRTTRAVPGLQYADSEGRICKVLKVGGGHFMYEREGHTYRQHGLLVGTESVISHPLGEAHVLTPADFEPACPSQPAFMREDFRAFSHDEIRKQALSVLSGSLLRVEDVIVLWFEGPDERIVCLKNRYGEPSDLDLGDGSMVRRG